ncbi:basic proline-rich protein-like [Meriones unguiculatus]|uniref:basic proline-rich protein-like n=1 Tax=Meriones unguiculatus TaxID=10047 RepID=UPI00293ECD81|nr:basic proline-rich protein-like [Meriones unguiculatus]
MEKPSLPPVPPRPLLCYPGNPAHSPGPPRRGKAQPRYATGRRTHPSKTGPIAAPRRPAPAPFPRREGRASRSPSPRPYWRGASLTQPRLLETERRVPPPSADAIGGRRAPRHLPLESPTYPAPRRPGHRPNKSAPASAGQRTARLPLVLSQPQEGAAIGHGAGPGRSPFRPARGC